MVAEVICAYCQKPGKLHRDHVVPRSRGGPDDATNVVMACQPCNQAKSDSLPSEWLGDRCPAKVLVIESRVHAKLRNDFKKRDYRKPAPPPPQAAPKLYALSLDAGHVEYIGEVVAEAGGVVRIHAVNVFSLWAGFWEPSELYDVPRDRCRLFADRDACLTAVDRMNNRASAG